MIGPGLPPPESSRPRTLWGVAAWAAGLFLFALALRLLFLGRWSFWADELATLRDARDLQSVMGYPVGYFLIGLAARLFGESEFVARLVPAVAGAATVPVLYLIGRRMASHRAGVFAAVFLSMSAWHLYYSQYARYYTLLVLFGLCAVWLLYRGIERDRKSYLAAGLLLLALAFWTHWSAALLVPGMVLYLAWSASGDPPRGLRRANVILLLAPLLLGGVLLAPTLIRFLAQWMNGAGFSLARAGLALLKILYRLEPAALLLAGVGVWLLIRLGDRRVTWLVSFASAPVVCVVLFIGFSQGGSRFAITALPIVLLLAATALDLLYRGLPPGRRGMVVAVTGLVIFSIGARAALYYTEERGQRPRWREAVAFVLDRGEANGEPIVMTNAPRIAQHYGAERVTDLGHGDSGELARRLDDAARRADDVIVMIEHVSNVAPSEDEWDAIRARTEPFAQFPLHVGPLDYSISIRRLKPAAK